MGCGPSKNDGEDAVNDNPMQENKTVAPAGFLARSAKGQSLQLIMSDTDVEVQSDLHSSPSGISISYDKTEDYDSVNKKVQDAVLDKVLGVRWSLPHDFKDFLQQEQYSFAVVKAEVASTWSTQKKSKNHLLTLQVVTNMEASASGFESFELDEELFWNHAIEPAQLDSAKYVVQLIRRSTTAKDKDSSVVIASTPPFSVSSQANASADGAIAFYEAASADGTVYFINCETEESVWELPPNGIITQVGTPAD